MSNYLTLISLFISIRFFFESERGIFPQTEFVFDLELPIDFKPENNDGEVDEFTLVKAADVSTIDIFTSILSLGVHNIPH